MDDGHRAPVATFHTTAPLSAGARVLLDESAAHHARVRRLSVGDPVRLTDGAGQLASGTLATVDKREVAVAVEQCERAAAMPALHLLVPVADRDRTLWLAEKCTELGVTSWQPVYFARSRSVSPRGEGEAFAAKVRARMIAALEQSAGGWLPEIRPAIELREINDASAQTRIVFDRSGDPVLQLSIGAPTMMLIGPEGGIEPSELSYLRDRGWTVSRIAANTLRFETAAVVGAGLLRSMLAGVTPTR